MLKLIAAFAAIVAFAVASADVVQHKAPSQWRIQEFADSRGYVAPGLGAKDSVMITVGEAVRVEGDLSRWFVDVTGAPEGAEIVKRGDLVVETLADGRELISQAMTLKDASGKSWIWVSRAIRRGDRAALVTLVASSSKLVDRYGREFKNVVISVRI